MAIGLLTEQDLTVLGQGFRRSFRISENHDFGALIAAIDDADCRHRIEMAMPPRQVP